MIHYFIYHFKDGSLEIREKDSDSGDSTAYFENLLYGLENENIVSFKKILGDIDLWLEDESEHEYLIKVCRRRLYGE